jgi:hypothetical protein
VEKEAASPKGQSVAFLSTPTLIYTHTHTVEHYVCAAAAAAMYSMCRKNRIRSDGIFSSLSSFHPTHVSPPLFFLSWLLLRQHSRSGSGSPSHPQSYSASLSNNNTLLLLPQYLLIKSIYNTIYIVDWIYIVVYLIPKSIKPNQPLINILPGPSSEKPPPSRPLPLVVISAERLLDGRKRARKMYRR